MAKQDGEQNTMEKMNDTVKTAAITGKEEQDHTIQDDSEQQQDQQHEARVEDEHSEEEQQTSRKHRKKSNINSKKKRKRHGESDQDEEETNDDDDEQQKQKEEEENEDEKKLSDDDEEETKEDKPPQKKRGRKKKQKLPEEDTQKSDDDENVGGEDGEEKPAKKSKGDGMNNRYQYKWGNYPKEMLLDVVIGQPTMKEKLLDFISSRRLEIIINETHKKEKGLALLQQHPQFDEFLEQKKARDINTKLLVAKSLHYVSQIHKHIDEKEDLIRGSKWKMTFYQKEMSVNDLGEEEIRYGNPKELDDIWRVVYDEDKKKKQLKCKIRNKSGELDDKFKPVKRDEETGLFIYSKNAKGVIVLGPRFEPTPDS